MLEFVKKYGYDITSQNGENGIINECIFRIKPKRKVAVEFGAPDRKYCSNINHLEKLGWSLFYFDDNPADNTITKAMITSGNVNELIPDCDVLSIDIDGEDYEVWQAYNGRPAVVVIEINSSLKPDEFHYSKERGSSFSMMQALGERKGYFLLCHTGNLIFVADKYRDLFPEIEDVTIEKFFNTDWL